MSRLFLWQRHLCEYLYSAHFHPLFQLLPYPDLLIDRYQDLLLYVPAALAPQWPPRPTIIRNTRPSISSSRISSIHPCTYTTFLSALQIRRHYSIPDYLNHTEHKNPIPSFPYTAIRKTPVPYNPSRPHACQKSNRHRAKYGTQMKKTHFHHALMLHPAIISASHPVSSAASHSLSHPLPAAAQVCAKEAKQTKRCPESTQAAVPVYFSMIHTSVHLHLYQGNRMYAWPKPPNTQTNPIR